MGILPFHKLLIIIGIIFCGYLAYWEGKSYLNHQKDKALAIKEVSLKIEILSKIKDNKDKAKDMQKLIQNRQKHENETYLSKLLIAIGSSIFMFVLIAYYVYVVRNMDNVQVSDDPNDI